MPIDEYALPKDLTAEAEQLTPVEIQNKRGLKREMIPGITQGKYLTILAVETEHAFSQEEYFALLGALKTNHGVHAMQTAFAAPIPVEEGCERENQVDRHAGSTRLHTAAIARLHDLETGW